MFKSSSDYSWSWLPSQKGRKVKNINKLDIEYNLYRKKKDAFKIVSILEKENPFNKYRVDNLYDKKHYLQRKTKQIYYISKYLSD